MRLFYCSEVRGFVVVVVVVVVVVAVYADIAQYMLTLHSTY